MLHPDIPLFDPQASLEECIAVVTLMDVEMDKEPQHRGNWLAVSYQWLAPLYIVLSLS